MPPLQIRNCPADVYESLRACALEENRSMAQQALFIIKGFLEARDKSDVRDSGEAASYRMERELNLEEAEGYRAEHSRGLESVEGYRAKRRKAFDAIDRLAPLPISDELPSGAQLLSAVREERGL